MTVPGWDERDWQDESAEPGFAPTPEEIKAAERREQRAKQHTVRLVVLGVLGAVVVALMIALVGPGLLGR